MAKSDTSERWFEARVVRGLTGVPQPEYSHDLAPTDFAATHNGYVQGKPTDIGGYYLADSEKVKAVMRPSATLNAILAAARA